MKISVKYAVVLAILLIAAPAFADDTELSVSGTQEASKSRFHFLTWHCEADAARGPETTPQSPPLEVDDPATPGCNHWEINVVAGGDLTRNDRNWDLPLLDINFGVGDNLQLKYEVPNLSSSTPEGSVSAIGESKVGVKYMFFEDEKTDSALAFYPQLSFSSQSADAVAKGLETPGSVVTLPLLFATRLGSNRLGDVKLTANVGYNLSRKDDQADSLSAGVGVGMPLSTRVSILSELVTEQAVAARLDEPREHRLRAGVGALATISKRFLLFGSIGHSLASSDNTDHTYVVTGFRLMTGGSSI